jgi:tetraacyldisaccharide 4'-kinase
MPDARLLDRVWFGDDPLARVARRALLPLETVYRGVVGVREALYDSGMLRAHDAALPTLSVGNVSVGGTGKTPVAAWIATGLVERGARPAVVLRGYGEDEPLVHRTLNPDVPVIVAADRVAGVAAARREGATVAVLDDAFQHRRIARDVDLVLVSADRWMPSPRMLPAGPWREPLRAIRRATLIVVTRKAASEADADAVNAALAAVAPRVPRTTLHLVPRALAEAGGSSRLPLDALAGREVRVLAAIADPRAFVRQLEALGARVQADTYPDHHHFEPSDIERFARALPPDGLAICTLKDAVTLAGRWPREAPTLWYVSQHVILERGVGGVDRILDDLARTRDRIER